jgi:hypothetical protein
MTCRKGEITRGDVSGVADRTPAAQNITSRFTASRTFSAGSATWCGHLRLRSYGASPPGPML